MSLRSRRQVIATRVSAWDIGQRYIERRRRGTPVSALRASLPLAMSIPRPNGRGYCLTALRAST
ncbi:MAG TPA: hypothetical protein VNO70_16730 [Blastocatellia bacterium]|nr:hypothetical protein [Blastocatellia bacterium]